MSKKQKSGGKGGSDGRVKISIPADLAKAIEAAGDSVEETVERLLRAATGPLEKGKGRIAGFFQDLAGPYLPQLEAVAKDVASRVAKDVATAAAAAALTTFAAKASSESAPAKPAPKPAARKPAAKAAPKPAAKPAAKAPAAAKPAAKPAPRRAAKPRAAARPRPPVVKPTPPAPSGE